MRFTIFLLLTLPLSIFGADRKFFTNPHEKHKEILRKSQKEKVSWWEGDHLFKDFGGLKEYLAKHGISFSSTYVIDFAANPVGGMKKGIAQASGWGLDVLYDFGKNGDALEGWLLYASMVWRFGTNLSSRKIENQFNVQQVFGGQNVRLVNLYLKKTFIPGVLWGKAGRLDAGNNFLQSDLYYNFINNAFDGNPVAVFYNTPFRAFPNGVWGAYLQTDPTDYLQGKVAVYNTNPNVNRNRTHGLDFSFRSPEGAMIVTEWGYLLNSKGKGLPGHYRFGVLGLTGKKEKFLGGKERNYSFYLMLDQMVYQDACNPNNGLIPFLAFLYAPPNRNLMPYFFVAGIVSKGLIPKLEKDRTSFGVAYGRFSSDLRKKQRAEGLSQQTQETVLELNHRFTVNPWFYIQPMVQYVITPKGISSTSNAWVFGLQSEVVF